MFRRISVLGDGFPIEIVSQTSKPSTGTGELSSLPPVTDKGERFQGRIKHFMIMWEWRGSPNVTDSYSSGRVLFNDNIRRLLYLPHIYLETRRNLGWVSLRNCLWAGLLLGTKQTNRSHIVPCNYPTSDCGARPITDSFTFINWRRHEF